MPSGWHAFQAHFAALTGRGEGRQVSVENVTFPPNGVISLMTVSFADFLQSDSIGLLGRACKDEYAPKREREREAGKWRDAPSCRDPRLILRGNCQRADGVLSDEVDVARPSSSYETSREPQIGSNVLTDLIWGRRRSMLMKTLSPRSTLLAAKRRF